MSAPLFARPFRTLILYNSDRRSNLNAVLLNPAITMTATPKLLLIDGHSLAFRSYYAFAKGRDGGLRTSTGVPTSVSFGFIKALLETIEAESPEIGRAHV